MKPKTLPKVVTAVLATAALGTVAACGGNTGEYPADDINYIIPFGTGGSTDPIGREFTRLMGEEMGTQFIVENLPGGDQTIGTSQILGAEPDGYTLGLATPSGLLVQPQINDDVPYDGRDDVEPLVKMMSGPYALVVPEDSEFETFDDFLEAAEESPGELRVGTTARISDNAFALLLLEDEANIETTMVPFTEGAGEAILALQSGSIEAAMVTAAGQIGTIESGDVRALAHTGPEEYNENLSGAVSMAEHGFDVPFASEFMTVGPSGMPDDVVEELTETAETVGASQEWLDWVDNQALVPDVLTGDDLQEFLSSMESANERALELLESRDEDR